MSRAASKDAELERLRDECDHLRIKLSLAIDAASKDGATITNLRKSIGDLERAITARQNRLGPESARTLV